MPLDPDAAYRALRTHDARFDGRLFVGVTSTGIYCRPVCRVRTPRQENCRFFAHAAAAEAQGFRPCLRCRPELAPGLALIDSPHALAHEAARRLDQASRQGEPLSVAALAKGLGVTDRHLRRIFAKAHGVTPIDYLATRRMLLAKQLLTDTPLPMTQVALAAGFGSLRRFNTVFAERYRMSPGALRQGARLDGPAQAAEPDRLTLRLAWRPPYDLEGVLRFFERRAIPGVEQVHATGMRRTLEVTHGGQRLSGWIGTAFDTDRHEVQVSIAPALAPALPTLLARTRQALDLDAEPTLIDAALSDMPGVPRPGVRLPSGWDGFEMAVRVILGQQVTVAAAQTLTHRLVQGFGRPVATPHAGLDRLFPDADTLAAAPAESIGTLGIVRQRVRALQALAAEVATGRLRLTPDAPLEATLDHLRSLPGLGDWSAQLIAMRALAWPDAWPATDIGVLKALGTRDSRDAARQAEAWRPWRAYAVMRLWLTLETP